MKLYKLDTIIKGELLRHGLSIHHYVKRAYLGLQFLRTVQLDSAIFIKTATLTITDNKVTIPEDYVDFVRIGIPNGQYVTRLSPDQNLYDGTSVDEDSLGDTTYWYPRINKYGENTGGYFGFQWENQSTFKVLHSEGKILLNDNVVNAATDGTILLQYITDGLASSRPDSTGAAEPSIIYVHPFAVDALRAYVDAESAKDGNRFVSRELEQKYYNELRKYRARVSGITIGMIKNSLRKRSGAFPKG